ncbi:hypothetical protein ABH935_002706 [Catenulispora sp. GAS73]|uniref:hypothetical protein n=1 Tax=Catenulispora sp. GAS73 TaxID=3156269 RepID=UPI003517B70F
MRANRGALRVLMGLTLVLCALFGVTGAAAIAARSSDVDRFAGHIEPLAVDLQQLYTALNDADATAASAYLSGSVVGDPLRDEYNADIAKAESCLASASRAAATDDTVSARLAAIAGRIPVYTGLVATAQTDNRDAVEPQPIGTAYLREASTLMRANLLPDALAAYQAEVGSLDETEHAVDRPWRALEVVLVLALAALVVAQLQLARRFRRRLNPGLLLASGTLLVAGVWSSTAVGYQNAHLTAASDRASRIRTLATASDSAIEAHADEALTLIAHGSDAGAYTQDFTAQLKTAVSAAASVKPPTAQLDDVATRLRDWSAVDTRVRAAADAADYRTAVATALGAGADDAARIADDLNAEMTGTQSAFVDETRAASADLSGLVAGEIVLAVLAAGAAGYGLNRRLAEYR